MQIRFATIALFTSLGVSCATERPATWDEVGDAKAPVRAAFNADRIAGEAFTDSACLADAEKRLSDGKRDEAHALALACLRRRDFMLLSRLSEPQWKGLVVERKDWDAALAASARASTPDALDLTVLGLSPSDASSVTGPVDARKVYVVYGKAVETTTRKGKPYLIVRPVVFESSTRTKREEGQYDLVDENNKVLEKGVTMVREKEVGSVRASRMLDERYFIALDDGRNVEIGERYIFLVDDVKRFEVGKKEDPDLTARLLAGSLANPRN